MTLPKLTLEEAQAQLLSLAAPLPVEHVDIEGALGRYLAAPLRARRTQPAADVSAMDGYAVAEGDLAGPWTVIGESAAGHPCKVTVTPGHAVRISTGALMPGGGAAVILQEDLTREADRLELSGTAPIPPHKHIRHRGMDFAHDGLLLEAGTRIGPAQAALAISAGHRLLPVRRMPRLTILDSGDELAADPEQCAAHQIPASNGTMLTAMARELCVPAHRSGPVADDLEALLAALDGAADADLIVTSGGASVGDHDLVKPALERWGARLSFWQVAIRPGKPLLVATRSTAGRQQIILGLPGNPVSSMVTAYLFMLPLLRAMLGAAAPLPRAIPARLDGMLGSNGARRQFVRGYWDGARVRPHVLQDSGALAALAASNVLIDRASHAPAAEAGETVPIYLLGNGGIT